MDEISKQSLDLHYALQGKIEIVARRHVETREDLSLLYTPGVAWFLHLTKDEVVPSSATLLSSYFKDFGFGVLGVLGFLVFVETGSNSVAMVGQKD